MTQEERQLVLKDFVSSSSIFDDTLNLSNECLEFRPKEDYWTIKEQIVHCLDVDIMNFTRYRKGIAEPDTMVLTMESNWPFSLDYQSSKLPLVINLMRLTREFIFDHLMSIIHKDWVGYYFKHPKYGKIEIESLIPACINHNKYHRELVDRNLKLWNELGK